MLYLNNETESFTYEKTFRDLGWDWVMNKLSLFGLGMAIGVTWFIAIIFVGIIAMIILKNGYAGDLHENVINSVVIFRGLFGLAYPGWAMDYLGTFLAGLWGFVHGFVAGYLIAFFYNIFSKVFNR